MDNASLATVIADTLAENDKIKRQQVNEVTNLVLNKLNQYCTSTDDNKTLTSGSCKKETVHSDGSNAVTRYVLENSRIVPGTLKGVVYRKRIAIQSFETTDQGKFVFSTIGQYSDNSVLTGEIDQWRGEVSFSWNTPPKENHIEVSYDYKVEDE